MFKCKAVIIMLSTPKGDLILVLCGEADTPLDVSLPSCRDAGDVEELTERFGKRGGADSPAT